MNHTIERTEVKSKKGEFVVSTVNLGGNPLNKIDPVAILANSLFGTRDEGFETMIFAEKAWTKGPLIESYAWWYDNEKAARDGHKELVRKLKAGELVLDTDRKNGPYENLKPGVE